MKKADKSHETDDPKGEKALVTIHRRLDMLLMFDRKNRELSTGEIAKRLRRDGDHMDESLVLRTLKQLEKAGLLERVRAGEEKDKDEDEDEDEDEDNWGESGFSSEPKRSKNLKWRWPMGLDSRLKLFPKFSVGEVIAFRLMELLLKPLLPKESYEAVLPYLRAARKQCEILPRWNPSKAWEAKVRVVPPAQPLLPPEPPIHLASD